MQAFSGQGKTGPTAFAAASAALLALSRACPASISQCSSERDTWVVMLVYSITFGGFVGMSSYVSLLLTTQYQISKLDAGFHHGVRFRLTGAMVAARWRPHCRPSLTGVKVLLVLLVAISAYSFGFAVLMPPLAGGIALLVALYFCFGLGNGAVFQLVPHRWKGKTGVMTGNHWSGGRHRRILSAR